MARLGELAMGGLFLLTGVFVCAVAVLATADGGGPPNPGLWVTVVAGGASLVLLGLTFMRPGTSDRMMSLLAAGLLLSLTGLGVAGLFFADSTADLGSERGPRTIAGARATGAVALLVPVGVVVWATGRHLRTRKQAPGVRGA